MLTPSPSPRSHRPLRLAAVAALGGLMVALSACGASTTPTAAGGAPADAMCPDGQIRFGIEPFESPAKLTPAYETLAEALTTKLNCPVKVQVVEDYSAEVLAMRNNQLELGQFGPLGYVFATQKAGAEPLVSFATSDGTLSSYTSSIYVAKDSPIQSIADLKDRSLAPGSVGSTSGDVLPRFALRSAGIAENALKMNYTGGHPEALLALTKGTVDAAEINSQTLATATKEGTFDASAYRAIWTSDPIPNDPITVRGSLDPALKAAIKTALLELDPADVAKVGGFLDVTPPGPMIEVTDETYRPLYDLAATMGLTEKDV